MDTYEVRRYLAHLAEHQYSRATMARKLATLRSFYKFLMRRSHVQANPVAPDPHAQAGRSACPSA